MTQSELYTITKRWPLTPATLKVGLVMSASVPLYFLRPLGVVCSEEVGRGYNTQKNGMFALKLLHWKIFSQPGHRVFFVSYPRREKGLEVGLDGVRPLIQAWSGYPSVLCAMSCHRCRVQGTCWLRHHLLSYLPDLPVFNATGVLLIQNGSQVSANFDGTVTISVIALSNILHASSSLSEEYRNHTKGLLGKKQRSDRTRTVIPPMGLGLLYPAQFLLSPLRAQRGAASHTV